MTVTYHRNTDLLYICLDDRAAQVRNEDFGEDVHLELGEGDRIVGIEILAAAQGCDFHAPLASSAPLERVRAAIRRRVPHLEADRWFADDIEWAKREVLAGAFCGEAADGLF